MRSDIPNKGDLKLKTRYRVKAMIMKVGQQEVIMKYHRRFFVAKKPFNPRQNFVEMTQQEVFRFHKCLSAGINITKVKFERNFYLSNEKVKAKCSIDNS